MTKHHTNEERKAARLEQKRIWNRNNKEYYKLYRRKQRALQKQQRAESNAAANSLVDLTQTASQLSSLEQRIHSNSFDDQDTEVVFVLTQSDKAIGERCTHVHSSKKRHHEDKFLKVLKEKFPKAMKLHDYINRTYDQLHYYGFTAENTLASVATCRDENCEKVHEAVVEKWGEAFDLSSLGGMIWAGPSGFRAGKKLFLCF